MYNHSKIKELNVVFSTESYAVAVNPLALKERRKMNKKTGIAIELQEPNYLVINLNTNAIEFTTDQLPAAIEGANHFTRAIKVQVEQANIKAEVTRSGEVIALVKKPN